VSGVRIPAGAPKNLLAFWRGDFFLVAPGESKFIPDRGNPRWSTKKYSLAFLAVDIFSGRSRGVEVYPRQGKSPLEHQKSFISKGWAFHPVYDKIG
jgi:hypothetical protein